MLTEKDRAAKYKSIEELRRWRAANVRKLKGNGSWVELARRCGRSDGFMIAIAGDRPRRQIGEVLARDLERVLGLPPGWLDETH